MKRNIFLSIILFTILFSACTSDIHSANMTMEYYDKQIHQKDCIFFENPRFLNSPYVEKILITTDQTVENLQLLDIKSEDGIHFYINEILFESSEFNPDKPLLVQTEFTEYIPNLALSYMDTDNLQKNYLISVSGEDGSIIMSDIEFIEKPQICTLHIMDRFIPVSVKTITIPTILEEIYKETNWNVQYVHSIEERENDIFIDFTDESFLVTGVQNQKEEYFSYDVITLVEKAFRSIQKTILDNYNPNARLYFSLNGQDIIVDEQVISKDIPYNL